MVLKKVALTGSTGMLGRHIKIILKSKGIEVQSISRSSSLSEKNLDLEYWNNAEIFDAIFRDADVIIHAGAATMLDDEKDEKKIFDTNVRACFNIGLWALKKKIPVIYLSGAIVYLDPFKLNQNENGKLGWSGLGGNYGLSKLLGENSMRFLRDQGLKVAILRPSSIYGHGISEKKIVKKLLMSAINDQIIEISEPVDDQIDFVHASDVAYAIFKILENNCWETFNLSSGKPVSIKEIAEECIKITGKGKIKILRNKNTIRNSFVKYSLNISHAFNRLKWVPNIDKNKGLILMKESKFYYE